MAPSGTLPASGAAFCVLSDMWFASFALFLPSGDVANCDPVLLRRSYVYQPRVAAKLPWVGKGYASNPERVASLFSLAPFTQPRWGWIFVRSPSQSSCCEQPWADIRSPLGQKSALPNPPGTLKPEEPKNPFIRETIPRTNHWAY